MSIIFSYQIGKTNGSDNVGESTRKRVLSFAIGGLKLSKLS